MPGRIRPAHASFWHCCCSHSAVSPAFAGVAYVQGNYLDGDGSTTSIAVTYPSAQAAGNLNFVAVNWCDDTSTVQSIADTSGNTYTLVAGPLVFAGTATQAIYVAADISSAAANTNSVTITFSTMPCGPEVRIAEYSGIDPGNPVDVTSGAMGTGTAQSSGVATTTNSVDVLVGANYTGWASEDTAGSGYALRMFTDYWDILEDEVVTSAGSYSATATQDADDSPWIMQLVALRVAAGAARDTQPPTAPTGLTASLAYNWNVNLTWNAATDNVGVTEYIVLRCQDACASYAMVGITTDPAFSDFGGDSSDSYAYVVRAIDSAGNSSADSNVASVPALANIVPTAPRNVSALGAWGNLVAVTWSASATSPAVSLSYEIDRCEGASCADFALLGNTETPGWNDIGTTACTPYSYRVRAITTFGAQGPYAAIATTTTPENSGYECPPGGLTASASASSETEIDLSWQGVTDSLGVNQYLIERCSGSGCTNFTQIGTTTTPSFRDVALSQSSAYSYRVRAVDTGQHISDYSNVATASTATVGSICD